MQLSCSVEHLLEVVPSLTALELDRCGTWFSEESDLTPLQVRANPWGDGRACLCKGLSPGPNLTLSNFKTLIRKP